MSTDINTGTQNICLAQVHIRRSYTHRTHGALMYPRPCRRSGGMRFSVQRGAPCQPCGRGDQAVCSETKLCKVVISHSPLAAPSHLLHKLQRQIQYRILEPFSTVSRVQVKAAIHREWVAVNNQSMQNGTALLLTPLPNLFLTRSQSSGCQGFPHSAICQRS